MAFCSISCLIPSLISALFLDSWLSAAYSAYSYLIPALFLDFGFLQHILLIPALFLAYSCLMSALFFALWLSAAYSAYSWLIPALFVPCIIPALFLPYFWMFGSLHPYYTYSWLFSAYYSCLISAKNDTNLLIIYVIFFCDILAANNKLKIRAYLALVLILTDLNHAARFPLLSPLGVMVSAIHFLDVLALMVQHFILQ